MLQFGCAEDEARAGEQGASSRMRWALFFLFLRREGAMWEGMGEDQRMLAQQRKNSVGQLWTSRRAARKAAKKLSRPATATSWPLLCEQTACEGKMRSSHVFLPKTTAL
eukprot:752856-Rhodomonas_salina.1